MLFDCFYQESLTIKEKIITENYVINIQKH